MNTLDSIARKHGHQDIADRIVELGQTSPLLHLGVLGEFSSGKSSLINAMLGRTVLPAMERPTTANVVEIHPEAERTTFAYSRIEERDGKAVEVALPPSDLSEWVMGRHGVTTLVIRTPTSNLLKAGWRIVDTPGISSLEQMHQDITFGYLPRLDGAIVCIDINQGGCTRSLLDFLAKPEVAQVADTFLFALTRADTVPPEDAEIVRRKTVADLEQHFGKTGIERLNEKVVVVSPRLILNGNAEEGGLPALWQAIRAACHDRMEEVARRRVRMETGKLAERLIERLHYRLQAINLDEPGFAAQRQALADRQAQMQANRDNISGKREELLRRLEDTLDNLSQDVLAQVLSTSAEHWPAILTEYTTSIRTHAEHEITVFFQGLALADTEWLATELGQSLEGDFFMGLLREAVENVEWLLAFLPGHAGRLAGKLPVRSFLSSLLDKWQASRVVEDLQQRIPDLVKKLGAQVNERVETEILAPAQSQIDAAQKDLTDLATREKQDGEARAVEKSLLETDIAQVRANIAKAA